MSNVANESAATGIQGFMQKLYKPIYVWANGLFATKTELAAATGAAMASEETCAALLEELT